MGKADYYADGDWNFYCDLCGCKEKASRGVKTWQGLYVCKWHKEERNQQDFVRGVRDDPSPQWTRPKPSERYIVTGYEGGARLLNGSALNVKTLN